MAHISATGSPQSVNPRLLLAGLDIPLWLAYAVLALASAGGLTVVYFFDPRNPGPYPICPFFGLTGCYCPGCGTLRALHQLLHGNPVAAFGAACLPTPRTTPTGPVRPGGLDAPGRHSRLLAPAQPPLCSLHRPRPVTGVVSS